MDGPLANQEDHELGSLRLSVTVDTRGLALPGVAKGNNYLRNQLRLWFMKSDLLQRLELNHTNRRVGSWVNKRAKSSFGLIMTKTYFSMIQIDYADNCHCMSCCITLSHFKNKHKIPFYITCTFNAIMQERKSIK